MPRALEALTRALRAIDEQAARERVEHGERALRTWIICLVSGLSLVFMEYVRERPLLRALYTLLPSLESERFHALAELSMWVGVRLLGFFLLPALTVRLVLRERLVDHGFALAGLRGHMRPYAIALLLVLPCVVISSYDPAFTAYYPFYRLAGASWLDLVVWEALYALQFVALEFFFRGFWVLGCRRRFGSQAALLSAVPYCMIHFTKPLPEVLAALPAGIVLGLLALSTRSIWGGALVHVVVALTMDLLALVRTTGLPTRLVP